MPVLHQKFDAVLLERDGVGVGLGHALNHLDVFHIELEAAGRALIGANLPGDDDARLLGEAFERLEHLRRDALYVGYALYGAGAVAKNGKQQLAAFAQVVEPSAQGDGLAFMLAQCGDGGYGGGGFGGFGAGCGGGFFRHDRSALWTAWFPTVSTNCVEKRGTRNCWVRRTF